MCFEPESSSSGRRLYMQLWYGTLYMHQYKQSDRKKKKISPITGPRCPEGSRKLRFPGYVTMAQNSDKVSLMHRPFLAPGNGPGTHFC